MGDTEASEVEQWLLKANSDLNSAKALLSLDLRDTGVYHCQQAAEKALKAYLSWRLQLWRPSMKFCMKIKHRQLFVM
ncbi:MAG: HEPN domain-containing protein, partial [Zetaproteobacteria bacterium]|nr:HEPN domain-containing protein [Zetaproteobacteria bacterium]